MDDEHHHHRLHQVPDYGDGSNNNNDTDLRHFFSPRPMFLASGPRPPPPPPPPPPLLHHQTPFSASGGAFTPLPYNPLPHYTYELVMDRGHVPDHVHHHSLAVAGAGAVDFNSGGGGGATARWPRQETLTLLEVRSRLDHKFKEANHKGPLWDEVSRIMCDEHGYQRSGKKCREKFENLYKYYKKTKGGKAGRQDGKNYRFFRQLDALYGDTSTANTASNAPHQFHTTMNTPTTNISLYDHHQEAKAHSISLTNSSSELQTSSSEDKAQRSSWKSKIKGFLDVQMKRIMDRQDSWLEKMETTLECREKERMMRDEEWRTRESERMEREHRLWVEERAWIEARDRAMISALEKISGKELLVEDKDLSSSLHSEDQLHPQSRVLLESGNKEEEGDHDTWEEAEMTELIRLRSSMDARFKHCGGSELDQVSLWEEIASRMASLGYDRRSATLCKEKWDLVNSLLMKNHSKRKESRRIESFGCSTSSHQQPGQSNLRYDYGEINCTRSNVTVPPDIGLGGGGGGGGGNPMNDSFTFLLGND